MRWQWMALALSMGIGLPARGQSNLTSRVAHEARIDLYATTNVLSLDQAEIVNGWGSISRLAWMKPAEQRRAYSFTFPLLPATTNELVFRFLPQESGRVTVALLGPYERIASEKDAVYRSEILWPSIDVAGASLTPESVALLKPPVRSWFKQRYDIGLLVQAHNPVTVRLGAAPVPISDAPTATLEPAAPLANTAFRRGINVTAGQDMARRSRETQLLRPEDFARIKSEGFDHVRLLLPFHLHAGPAPEFVLHSNVMNRLDGWVQEASRQRLAVVIGWQDYDALAAVTTANVELPRFLSIWKQIAQRYAANPATLGFEPLSLANSRATIPTTTLNLLYRDALKVIREQAPTRTLLVSPGLGASLAELMRLQLPAQETNLLVVVSSREPVWFTLQSLVPSVRTAGGIRFPGPSETIPGADFFQVQDPTLREWLVRYSTFPADRNPSSMAALRPMIQFAKEWARNSGRTLFFADWGCPDDIEPASRARYYAAWRSLLAEADLGWSILDWKQQNRYWDETAGQPMVGLREALFPGRGAGALPSGGSNPDSGNTVAAPATGDTAVPLQQALKQLDSLREEVATREKLSQKELETFREHAKQMELHARQAQLDSAKTQTWLRWLLSCLLLAGAVAVLLMAFRYRQRSLGTPLPNLPLSPGNSGVFQPDELKEGTMAHLARLLSDKVIQRLLAERRLSTEAQRSAALEIAEMEQRLERLQTPWQERLKAYEARILELEGELARKGEENRELIRAKIDLTRQRMESARTSPE